MNLCCRSFLGGAVLLTAIFNASLAHAQRGKKQQQALPPVEVKGKIVGVQRGLITMMDNHDQETLVKVDPRDTRVFVFGTALPSVLQNGMFVRFAGQLTRGTAKEPVEKLQIFEPSEGIGIGVFRDDPTDPNSETVIAGELRSFKKGKLTIAAGRQKVQARLAESAEITFEVSDYSIARPGDDVKVLGKLFAPGKVIASQVDITVIAPLGESKKKPRKKRSTRGRKKKTSKSDE